MLLVVQGFGEDLPAACKATCSEIYPVFDTLLASYGTHFFISERVCRVLRLGIQFFGDSALPVVPNLLVRIATEFDRNGFASFLWLQGKTIGQYGTTGDRTLLAAFQAAFEAVSARVFTILKTQSPGDVPDGRSHLSSPHRFRFDFKLIELTAILGSS